MSKSKIFKIILIITLLLSACIPFSYATESETVATTSNVQTENADSTTVSTVSSVQNDSLDFTNILNILLIAIGVIIILLAIAILIRLKKSF